jgi:hypothetical protein
MIHHPIRCLALCAALAGFPGPMVTAQESERGSRFVESGHWAYEYLARLRTRGYLGELDPLLRPHHRADIVRALSALDPDTLPRPVADWVRLLRSEFGGEERAWGAVVMAGSRAANTDRLDPLRPLGEGGVWPNATAGAWFEGGHVAAESRVMGDLYLDHDPDLRPLHRPLGLLAEHSYLSLSVAFAGVTLGRVARNWGPAGTRGLMISDGPLAYPQLGFEGRFGRLGLQAFTAELDTLEGSRRYLAAQRLAYTAPHFAIAVANAVMYSGPNVAPSLQLLNPVAILAFERENPPGDDRAQNYMLSVQAWYQRGGLVLHGEALLDDVDLNTIPGYSRAPLRYAFTAGARVSSLAHWVELAAEYSQVSSFAYRAYGLGDRYDYLGRGLGESFADHERLSITADLFPPVSGLTLTPAFVALRQGEGDFRVAMPSDSLFRLSPNLILGVAERTYRIGLRGRYQPMRQLWLSWDIGHNDVRDAGHVPGGRRTDVVALGEVGLRFDFGARRR